MLWVNYNALSLELVSCPFTGPKMFWTGPIFLCHTKFLFTIWGSHKHFVSDKKDDLHLVKLVFVEALNAVKFLGWFKKFGPAQTLGSKDKALESRTYEGCMQTFQWKSSMFESNLRQQKFNVK